MGYSKANVIGWLEALRDGSLNLNEDNSGLADAAIGLIDPGQSTEDTLPQGYLTPHFQLAEFTYSETATVNHIDNTPSETGIENLTRVAECLESIRDILGSKPITITSGYRCPELNKMVGGAENSAHLTGLAADMVCPEYGMPIDICNAILPYLPDLGIDQLINESNSSGGKWVHVGLTVVGNEPRCEALTIGPGGTQTGIV